MALEIRQVDYFTTTVRDQPGEAYKLFTQLSDLGIMLVAFTGIPLGPSNTQFTLFPEDSHKMVAEAGKAGMKLIGPNPAILVQGDDELGTLAKIHDKLYKADVNVYAASGVTDGRGCFGYVMYVKPEDISKAVVALGI